SETGVGTNIASC
ncbi:hypothetical protein D046_3479B, partial [Vibrio parahaemolyticus V-223/04]